MQPRTRTALAVASIAILVLTCLVVAFRFWKGLGAATNLTQDVPWGIWKGFNVVTGVALAGGAYVMAFMVYVLGIKKYHPIVRLTVLNGFLAYAFYIGALTLELGRPWNVINPMIGNSFGVSSVLFLVAWHMALYLTAMFVELSPAFAEWLGLERARKILSGMTLGAVILGVTLSTGHQSGLGSLFLMAGGKIHPLWFSTHLPLLFFVSSVFGGLSMVIVQCALVGRFFGPKSVGGENGYRAIQLGLARICTVALFAYLFMKAAELIHHAHWTLVATWWGGWYMFEIIGLGLVPCLLFYKAARTANVRLTVAAASLAALGVVLNRLNISVITYKWYLPTHYVPTWMEVVVSLGIVVVQLWVFRWLLLRVPILESHKLVADEEHSLPVDQEAQPVPTSSGG